MLSKGKMMYSSILVLVMLALLNPTDAFTTPLNRKIYSASSIQFFMGDTADAPDDVMPYESTELSQAQEVESQLSSQTASGMDILNSPQFIARKRDVLINDLQKIQNDIALAKESLQQNKVEWGAQIADLQKEYEMIQQRMNVQRVYVIFP